MKPLFTADSPVAFDLEQTQQASRALSSITKETYSLRMPSYQLALVVLWHDLWGSFNKEHLPLTDVLRINGALEVMGKAMRVQSILSRKALLRFRYWVTSMTDFHLSQRKKGRPLNPTQIITSAFGASGSKELIQ